MKRREALLLSAAVMASPFFGWQMASAFTKLGHRIRGKQLDITLVNSPGAYAQGIQDAASVYRTHSDLTVNINNNSANYCSSTTGYAGNTGWEAMASWSLGAGNTVASATITMNRTYCDGKTVGNLSVVYQHEIGHVLGLGHVSSPRAVMNNSASAAYQNGVRILSADELAGLKEIYQ